MKRFIVAIKNGLKENYLALFFAIFVGVVSFLPQMTALYAIGEQYQDIPFLYQDSEYSYLARIQDISDGYPLASSPMFYEYKNHKAIIPPIGEYFYFLGGKIINIPIIDFVYFSKFLFPAILFLTVYFLVKKLTIQNESLPWYKINAIMGGLFVTMGYEIFNYTNALPLILGESDGVYLSLWTRLVNPVIGAIFLFIFLNFLWEVLNNKRTFIIPTAIVLFLMVGYVFSFGIAFSINIIWLLVLTAKKRFSSVKDIFLILVIFTFIFLIFLAYSSGQGYLSSDPFKMGLFFTRELMINKLSVLSLFFFFVISFMHKEDLIKKDREGGILWWWFLLSFLISSPVLYNQQLLTGFTVWPQHFVQYTTPLFIVIIVVASFNFFSSKTKYYPIFILSIMLISIILGLRGVPTYEYVLSNFIKIQRYGETIKWINSNANRDCAVLSIDNDLNYFVPSLTHCNSYIMHWVFLGVPQERILHNYLLELRLKGVKEKDIDNYLLSNKQEIVNLFFRDWRDLFEENNDPWLNKISNKEEMERWKGDLLSRLSGEYKKFLKKDLSEEIKKYRVDYVIISDKDKTDFGDIKLDLIEGIDGFKIYKI